MWSCENLDEEEQHQFLRGVIGQEAFASEADLEYSPKNALNIIRGDSCAADFQRLLE